MSSSNCCFLTCIPSQEAGQVVWYSHLFQNFPQFIVIHRVEGFGLVNKAEMDVFLQLSCFFDDQSNNNPYQCCQEQRALFGVLGIAILEAPIGVKLKEFSKK